MIELVYKLDGKKYHSKENETDVFEYEVSSVDNRTQITLKAKKPIELVSAKIRLNHTYHKSDLLFCNGYQSWTDTKEFKMNESVHNMYKTTRLFKFLKKKMHLHMYGDINFYKYWTFNTHGFTYSYIKEASGKTTLIGSLNEENAYLIINHHRYKNYMTLESDCAHRIVENEFVLFDFVTYEADSARTAQELYFANYGKCDALPIKGYTSWYNDYQNISEEKMLKALEGIDPAHYDLFQIDDGYETFVGDWLDIDPNKFPNGLQPIVDKIHEKGLKAGIWLAPFVAETKSKLYQEHPNWIYKEEGKEVFAGCNWSGDVCLDLSNKDVLIYIKKCLNYYLDLGIDFFKLDFLYAAALVNDNNKYTRAEQMREGMKFIRAILGDKLILGCGVPLSSAFNLVDYCRIGPDVSLKFDDQFFMKNMHRERISTKVTLQNTIYRQAMDGSVFRNDPDVYLLRDDNIELSNEQKKALIMINSLCGSVYMTSDNVTEYDDEKSKLLEEARKLCGAKVLDVTRKGKLITISYELEGSKEKLVYNTKKGVLV